jgi:hypothetical protein
LVTERAVSCDSDDDEPLGLAIERDTTRPDLRERHSEMGSWAQRTSKA